MKKLVNAKLSLAAFAAAFAIVSTGCNADVNLNVTNDNKTGLNNATAVLDEAAGGNESSEEKEEAEAPAEEKEAEEEVPAAEEKDAETEEKAEEAESSEGKTEEAESSEEKTEEASEEKNPYEDVIRIESDGTAVVKEDGIRYGRMTLEKDTIYSRFSAEEIEKINEDLKIIEHDAFEKYGNWQRSSTEEQQHASESYITFRDIDWPDGYLKGIWAIDVGNPLGEVYYDMNTLRLLTVEDLFGSDWADNNLGNDTSTTGSTPLAGKITYFWDYETKKVHIMFKNGSYGADIDIIRDYIVQDYVGVIDGSAK